MSIEAVFSIANSALTAQSERITLIAQNLANANSVEPNGNPYQRRMPVFEVAPVEVGDGQVATGVKLAAVVQGQSTKPVYDPANPLADASGMVNESSVNPIYELVDLLEASRSYQANLSLIESARTAALDTINLLK
jgi:flagellar basal-body rod protein FlgC